jgi:D-glycero-alpha-D-manno-heptose-7-phosphate kinase
MRKTWEAKKRLADNVTTSHIDHAVQSALDAGARAGKVSGAGGGGFVTFLLAPERRVDVIRALSRLEGHVMTCHFTRHGTEGWKIF